jgi:thiosulfate/3-mercaptopyruvate sulfurtransferase
MISKTLITPAELSTLLTQKSVAIIDTRSPEEYEISHIPGAVNIREIFTYLAGSTEEDLINLQLYFTEILAKAGISGQEQIILYEDAINKGYGQSCRGYFLLKYLGCPTVSVLCGGYRAWVEAKLPTTTEVPQPQKQEFIVNLHPEIMVTKEQMLQAINDPNIIILDVRDSNEWFALASSPYTPNFCPRKGRIPSAVWIEWYRFMTLDKKIPHFREKQEILAICQSVGINLNSTVYIYCFKGSRAANTLIALQEAGIKNVRNYFASWNEWSRDLSLPVWD